MGTIAACLLLIIPFVTYYSIFRAQYLILQQKTLHLQILSTRAAILLPIYSTLMFISFITPPSYEPIQVVISIGEGYSLLCLFALIVENFGSPDACISKLESNDRQPFCWCLCYSPSMPVFYASVSWALLHALFTRPILVLAAIVSLQLGLSLVFLVFNVLAALQIVYAFITLVNFCK